MNKRLILLIVSSFSSLLSFGQNKAADSVVIRVGESSKVIFAIHDRQDLETLRHYNFQALMDDMITKLEQKDTSQLTRRPETYLKDSASSANTQYTAPPDTARYNRNYRHHNKQWNRRTYHTFNMDIGTNNYLQDGKFPDQTNEIYSVHPWGSWYVAFNSLQRTHVGGKFFLEWGLGVSWYNFKFQNDNVTLIKNDDNVVFQPDPRQLDFTKSKLTATYLNAFLVPMIDFGKGGRKTTIFDGSRVDFSSRGNHSSAFRIGLGPYAGYLLDSYTKQVYTEGDDKNKERKHDSYYLNNIRYGMRLQMGFRDVDVFFNYDMNKLFVDNKGPSLNAFSFGVTF